LPAKYDILGISDKHHPERKYSNSNRKGYSYRSIEGDGADTDWNWKNTNA